MDYRAVRKRLMRRVARLTGTNNVSVSHHAGAYRVVVSKPERANPATPHVLSRYLQQLDDFADLEITCEVMP